MPSILCIGEDYELLETRAEVLRRTGAGVKCSTTNGALRAIQQERFDLVVVCHSVEPGMAQKIYAATHGRLESSVVLRMTSISDWTRRGIKGSFDANAEGGHPATLVSTVVQLLRTQAEAAMPASLIVEA